jgi:hypothetical protein
LIRAWLFALSLIAAPAVARECTPPAGFDAADRAESRDFVIYFRADPAPIDVGRLFALEAVVCRRDGAATPTGLAVDAGMPEHRHGMNYRPAITAQGPQRYRADGLLFHMPGRWQIVFDVKTGKGSERLAADVIVR